MESTASENSLAKQVPVEGLQMADVKDNAVALRNRTLVKKFGLDLVEQLVGLETSLAKTRQQFLPDPRPRFA